MRNYTLISIFLILLVSCANSEPDVNEIWQKHLATYGKLSDIQKIKTYSEKSTIESFDINYPGKFHFKTTIKYPDKLFIEMIAPDSSRHISIFNGTKGVRISGLDTTIVTESEFESFQDDAHIFSVFSFLDRGFTLKYEGRETVDGTVCYKISIEGRIKPKTFFIDAISYKTVKTGIFDFYLYPIETKIIEGALFDIKVKFVDMESEALGTRYDHKINPEVNDSLFIIE